MLANWRPEIGSRNITSGSLTLRINNSNYFRKYKILYLFKKHQIKLKVSLVRPWYFGQILVRSWSRIRQRLLSGQWFYRQGFTVYIQQFYFVDCIKLKIKL